MFPRTLPKMLEKGDGGVGTFDVGRGGEGCLHFWFKSSNFLGARQNKSNQIEF